MTPAKINKPPEQLVSAITSLLLDVFEDTATAAAAAGVNEDVFVAACADKAVMAHVKAEVMRLQLSGKTAELKATKALDGIVGKLADSIDSDEGISASMLVRIGEFMHRVSGADAKRNAEIRATADDAPKAEIFILKDGDVDPPAYKSGYRVCIDMRSKQRDEKVIEHD